MTGFALPWRVRYLRWWWLRDAWHHSRKAAGKMACGCGARPESTDCPYRGWHAEKSAEARCYARLVVRNYHATGKEPFCWLPEFEARVRMRQSIYWSPSFL